MKKLLFALSLSVIFVVAGCGQTEEKEKTNTTDAQEQVSENEIKSTLLDTQIALASELRDFNKKIVAYKQAITSLKDIKKEDELKEAKVDVEKKAVVAKEAAENAVEKLDAFKIDGKLTEDMKATYTNALNDLKAYFTESKKAIDASLTEPDFTTADEKFKSFQEQLTSAYEEVGLLSPNMMKELQ